jgi:hypothetical protein
LILANGLLFFEAYNTFFPIKIPMPLPIEVVEQGLYHMDSGDLNVRLVDAFAKLEFMDAPESINRIVIRLLLVAMGLMWFIFYRLKQFTYNIRYGNIFELENINKLKHVSYGLFAIFVLSRVYVIRMTYYVREKIDFSTVELGREMYDTDYIFMVALLLWALAHVFMRGIEMKEDQDLTI